MTNYEDLLSSADAQNVEVIDRCFSSNRIKGLYCDGTIALSKRLSNAEKNCVLAEELGHHYTSSGVILDMNSVSCRKQERQARLWAYNRLIGLQGIISAFKAGCRSTYEIAEHLNVSEDFLQDALAAYRSKYGPYTKLDNYLIYFEPNMGIYEMI